MQKSEELLAPLDQVRSFEDLKAVSEKYYNWDAYNLTLLKRLFSGPIEGEYSSGFGFAVLGGQPNLKADVDERRDDIRRANRRLASIRERLGLWADDLPALAKAGGSGPAPATTPVQTQDTTVSERKVGDRVFLVHGRDEATKQEVARFLEHLEIDPLILNEQPNSGRTLVEKLEFYSGQVGFAILVLSPDDEGRLVGASTLETRPRQNVVFEAGYFIGLLGRGRVCVLLAGEMTSPSDIDGVAYLAMSGNWKLDLANELRAAGYSVDLNGALKG